MFQSGPIHGWRRRARCSKECPVSGSSTENASGDHWLPCRTSDTAHHCNKSEGKVRLEADKGDNLRRERVWCAMGVGGSPGVGTVSDGWCTLGDRIKIGDDGIAGCRSAGDSFGLASTSRIVARGMPTLGGGGTCAGEGGGATGIGITLGGSIAVINGVSCGTGGS